MKNIRTIVSIIRSNHETDNILTGILRRANYEVRVTDRADFLTQLGDKQRPDLIICPSVLEGQSAFSVFKGFKPHFIKSGIPFFVWLDRYDQEEVEIGLELGVDNFLFAPFNSETVLSKVDGALKKRHELNVFDLASFENYFAKSSVAMLYLERNTVSAVNDAFVGLTKASKVDVINVPFDMLFDLNSTKQNHYNYKRFRCGAINSCTLVNITCCCNPNLYYDISFFRGNQFDIPSSFAELQLSSTVYSNTAAIDSSEVKHNKDGAGTTSKIKLTRREKEIYELSAKGWGLKQIAAELNLSQRTVEKHRSNIMKKTDTHSMYEAILSIGRTVYE